MRIFQKFSYNQAVILVFDASQLIDIEANVQKFVNEFEKNIEKILPEDTGIDGHDFGENECTIYIYGPSADQIWKSIESFIQKSNIEQIQVTLQYGLPQDPKTQEKKFSIK